MNDLLPASCRLCPRACGADRAAGQRGLCGADDTLVVARAALHFWEEPPISGQAGSGSGVDKLCKAFGIVQKGWVMENWVLISIVLQLAVAACLLALAIWFVNPIRRRRKKRG